MKSLPPEERTKQPGWTFKPDFIARVAAAAAKEEMKPTVWVRMILLKALRDAGV